MCVFCLLPGSPLKFEEILISQTLMSWSRKQVLGKLKEKFIDLRLKIMIRQIDSLIYK